MTDWEKRYTDLVRILSHDLRAPLRHVTSFSELLLDRRDELDEKQKQWLDYVRDSGELAQSMLTELLLLSRVYQAEAVTTTLEISGWAEQYAAEASLDCTVEVARDRNVHADDERLTRALNALVKNAREWGGGATLHVLEKNGCVEIHATQPENELPEEKWEDACQPFGRMGQRPELGHIGMGLPLALALAESFGGAVQQCEGGVSIVLPNSPAPPSPS